MLSLIGLLTLYYLVGNLITWVTGEDNNDMGYKGLMWGPIVTRQALRRLSEYKTRYQEEGEQGKEEKG